MKIAIQGHKTRGKEIIQILESLGGRNLSVLSGKGTFAYYRVKNSLIHCDLKNDIPHDYKLCTLEEFETQFPFKVGDKVMDCSDNEIGRILGFIDIDDESMYVVNFEKSGHASMPAEELKPYKEMQERNITLTLEKAKEWYKKGGELREIALQAFKESELNPLPRSWKEFCENHPIKDREAHLAMIQLEQLRNCWRQGWKPDWLNGNEKKYAIKGWRDKSSIEVTYVTHAFLSFPTYELALEFQECFRDLIEQAGDLI